MATNDDEDHPHCQHPSVCAIPSRQVHQCKLTSGVHLQGIYAKPVRQTHMGFHTCGTLETHAREHSPCVTDFFVDGRKVGKSSVIITILLFAYRL